MKKLTNFRYFPFCLLGLIGGIVLSAFVKNIYISLAVLLVFGAVATVFAVKFSEFSMRFLAVVLALCVGFLSTQIVTHDYSKNEINAKTTIIGRVSDMSDYDLHGEVKGDVYLENVSVNGEKIKGKVHLLPWRKQSGEKIYLGDKVEVFGEIIPFKLIAEDSRSMNNYKHDLRHCVEVESILNVEKGKLRVDERLKLWVANSLDKNMSSSASSFSYAMLFGDKQFIAEDVKLAFSRIGIAHIFAVSGLHIATLIGALLLLLKKFRVKKNPTFVVVSLASILITYLCGFSPSSVRACCMILTGLVAKNLGRKNDIISTVSFAAIIILIFKPLYLFELSFLLSFSAVFGIAFFAKPIRKMFKMKSKTLDLLSVSLAVNIFTLPFLLYYFKGMNLIFIVANAISVPFVVMILPVLLLCVTVSVIPFLGYFMWFLSLPLDGLIAINLALSKIPFLTIQANLNPIIIVAYMALLTIISRFVFAPKKVKQVIASVLVLVCVGLSIYSLQDVIYNENTMFGIYNPYDDTQIIVIKNSKYGNTAIINGKLTSYTLSMLRRASIDKNIGDIDFIAKYEFSEGELMLLSRGQKSLGLDNIACNTVDNIHISLFGSSLDIIETPSYAVVFEGQDEVRLVGDDFNFLFCATPREGVIADAVFHRDKKSLLKNPYFKGHNQKASESNFTFNVKDGNIIKIRFWDTI